MEIPRRPPASNRTVSSGSAVSHMDLQIKHHWNDGIAPAKLISRSVSPLPPVSVGQLKTNLDLIVNADSKLTEQQHRTHVSRLDSLDLDSLSVDQRMDLNESLIQSTPEQKRKAIVEFIRNNDGVIKWAASLRALAESIIV